MDEQQIWRQLRARRGQKDGDGSQSADGRDDRKPAARSARKPEDDLSPWKQAESPVLDPAVSEEARKTLRAALEAFREQQGSSGAETMPRVGRPGAKGPAEPKAETPSGDEAPSETPPGARVQGPRSKRDVQEALEYLEDVLTDYERFVSNIGENGFTAPMTLYYRDEVQDLLDELTYAGVEMQAYWRRTVELDNVLREHAQELVDEIGWANFKQYQIINDPPRQNWWWYLNRETRSPPPPPAFWQFWKK